MRYESVSKSEVPRASPRAMQAVHEILAESEVVSRLLVAEDVGGLSLVKECELLDLLAAPIDRALSEVRAERDGAREMLRANVSRCQKAEAERDELLTRRDELLATVARLSRETPYNRRLIGVLTAEVSTLKAKVAEVERDRGYEVRDLAATRAEVERLKADLALAQRAAIEPACAFCGKKRGEVPALVAGPVCWICITCVRSALAAAAPTTERVP